MINVPKVIDIHTGVGAVFVSDVCKQIQSSLALGFSLQDYAERLPKVLFAPKGRNLGVVHRMEVTNQFSDHHKGKREIYVRQIGDSPILGGNSRWRLSSRVLSARKHYSIEFHSKHELVNPKATVSSQSSVDGQEGFQGASISQVSETSLDQIHPVLGMHEILKASLGVVPDSTDYQATLISLCQTAFHVTDAQSHCNRLESISIRIMEEESGIYDMVSQARMSRDEYEQCQQTDLQNMKAPTAHRAYIALGSNMGNRVKNIESACQQLTKRNIVVARTSSLYETKPMYFEDQQSFVNGACEVFDRHRESTMPMRLTILHAG